jgi:hypothetical protein
MNQPSDNIAITGWTNRILVGLFVAFLWLPTLDTIFHFDSASPPDEKRLPAEFPEFESTPGGCKKYLAGLEAYFNDHFGCRKCLVKWNNNWKWAFFRDQSLRHDAIMGQDGWVYLAECQMVEHYRGVLQFTPEQLQDWQTVLEHRRDRLAQRGIKYLFVIAPDKQSIYPEFLPPWLTKVRPQTKLDQFLAHMRAHSTVEVLDLRGTLISGRSIAPTYFQTDSHWNPYGAFLACQEVVKSLAKQLPGLPLVPLDAYNLTNRIEPGKDMASFVGLNLIEHNAVYLLPKPGLPSLETTNIPFGKSNLLITENPQARGSALVFQDSFGRYWSPFLGCDFGKVTYVWQYQFDAGMIEREQPLVVISEIVERNFNINDPLKMQAEDALK